MPGQNDLPLHNDIPGPLNDWRTKKWVMKFLNVGRSTFAEYKKLYGLKTSKIGHREWVHINDLEDFLRRLRK